MQLTKQQSTEFETFISKIPISKVRSDIERLWSNVVSKGYTIKMEEVDTLKDYSIHLPVELQSFPQTFDHWVKNEEHTAKDEKDNNTPKKEQAHLGEGVASIHEGIKVVDKNTEDNSVADTENVDNVEAKKEVPDKKDKRKELTKEAKAGDMHRTIKGMSNDTPAPKTDKKVKEVIVTKPAKKVTAKKKK